MNGQIRTVRVDARAAAEKAVAGPSNTPARAKRLVHIAISLRAPGCPNRCRFEL